MGFSFDFKPLPVPVPKVIENLGGGAERLVRDTIDDLRAIHGASSACLAQLDAIRSQLLNRALEYATTTIQGVTEQDFQAIYRAYSLVEPEIRQDPRPSIVCLDAKKDYFHDRPNDRFGSISHFQDFNADLVDFRLNHIRGRSRGRHVLFLVHGMSYHPDERFPLSWEALDKFARNFEGEARVFGQVDREDIDLWVVSWDSELTDEIATRIAGAIVAVGLFATRDLIPSAIMAAVFWRELERRAAQVAQFLEPFAGRIYANHTDVRIHAITHSLGCRAWADMIGRLHRRSGVSLPYRLGTWWNMQPAIPNNAFGRHGEFAETALAYYATEVATLRTWYSHADYVLSTAYVLAKHALAMGQVGSGNAADGFVLKDMNVTALSGTAHGEDSGGYMGKVGPAIRAHLSDFGWGAGELGSTWVYDTGRLTHIGDGVWEETDTSGGRATFLRVAGPADFVELYDRNRDIGVRLYPDRMLIKQPGSGEWFYFRTGRFA